jgi:uncharacterized protein (TIGR02145 family)
MKKNLNRFSVLQIGFLAISIIFLLTQCKKDIIVSCTDDGTFLYEGRSYSYKTIGTQTWMTENLAYLPSVNRSEKKFQSFTEPRYYVYGYEDEDPDFAVITVNYSTYGVLYNWPAAMAACPPGWHLPTADEWMTLIDYCGGIEEAGGSMKEEGTAHWIDTDYSVTNEKCFTALPGGVRSWEYGFLQIGENAYFWTATASESDVDCSLDIFINDDNNFVSVGSTYRCLGQSIRCVRD